jgi:hypothetical protein
VKRRGDDRVAGHTSWWTRRWRHQWCRSTQTNRRSLPGSRDNFQIRAHGVRPLGHAHEPKTTASPTHFLEIESPSVIGAAQLDVPVESDERHGKLRGIAMDEPVSKRLLSDPEEADGHVGIHVSEIAFGVKRHLNLMTLLDLATVPLQGCREAEESQAGGMQLVREAPDPVEDTLRFELELI